MNDKLNEMWTALAVYQPKADADGHGESWALMCSERTTDAAHAAWDDAAWDDAAYAAYAAAKAVYASAKATYANDACDASDAAIDYINKAK
jgi:hypothetical protein